MGVLHETRENKQRFLTSACDGHVVLTCLPAVETKMGVYQMYRELRSAPQHSSMDTDCW